jgi:hypothetical protein
MPKCCDILFREHVQHKVLRVDNSINKSQLHGPGLTLSTVKPVLKWSPWELEISRWIGQAFPLKVIQHNAYTQSLVVGVGQVAVNDRPFQ